MQLNFKLKNITLFIFCLLLVCSHSYAQSADSTKVYKKKVLETTEVDVLMSLYNQNGVHSPVNGGIGTELLEDRAANIIINTPLNGDDVLTIDLGISAYTSASSSNINPFVSNSSQLKSMWVGNATGASKGSGGGGGGVINTGGGGTPVPQNAINPVGTPWLASTGASHYDSNKALHVNYAHSSNDRNFLWGTNMSVSNEFDYTSFGFGGNLTKLMNEKNTEVGLKGSVYLDQWRPIYPTELKEYQRIGPDFQYFGYFQGVTILDQAGKASLDYLPSKFTPWTSTGRNSFTLSFYASQIISSRLQGALFFDLVVQQGMLSTPYQRVYFSDKPNYYIGTASDIQRYTNPLNHEVYQLADDIEVLPTSRFKLPLGGRMSYYINENFVFRGYYRYYTDDWGLKANTLNFDLPIRMSQAFSITPSYRYYAQNQVDYFAPYEMHKSTERFFTSDYDLSQFTSDQYSLAFNYTQIFNTAKPKHLGFKNANLKFSHYNRSDGLNANIVSFGVKFVGN